MSKYRKDQIEAVQTPKTEFLPKIKIQNEGKSTNFLNITWEELQQIKELLTTKDV